jgi:hypothetical protein
MLKPAADYLAKGGKAKLDWNDIDLKPPYTQQERWEEQAGYSPSTIAAITTSGGGVVTTADSSGNLSLLSGATTVVAVTATGVAVTGALTTSGNLLFNSGYGSAATAYGCRAWVNFNGTGTVAIRASGNVSSITDNNTGDYTVNFTTAMVDANYITAGTATRNVLNNYASFFSPYVTITTSTIRIQAVNFSGATEDSLHTSVAIFR